MYRYHITEYYHYIIIYSFLVRLVVEFKQILRKYGGGRNESNNLKL